MNEYKTWVENLDNLNDKINSLEVWDGYAERLQAEYDNLLAQEPKK